MSAPVTERRSTGKPAIQWPSHRPAVLVGLSLVAAIVVVCCLLPELGVNSYVQSVAYTVAFFAAVAQSWNIMSGFTGYISFAHGALVGVGSYAGILAANHGAGLPVTVLAGAAAALVASVLVGLPSLRLRGIAFAFATIFFQAAALLLAQKLKPITHGPRGLPATEIKPIGDLLVAMVLIAGVATALIVLLRRSRIGLQLLSIREDETAAQVAGIATVRLKLGAFAVSALFAGAAGSVHGFFLATLFPSSVFNVQGSIEPLVISLVGGPATAFGAPAMAVVYGLSQEYLSDLGSELQLALLGVVLVLAVLFAREGLAGLGRDAWIRLNRARSRSGP